MCQDGVSNLILFSARSVAPNYTNLVAGSVRRQQAFRVPPLSGFYLALEARPQPAKSPPKKRYSKQLSNWDTHSVLA
jgi:hypothetical protein